MAKAVWPNLQPLVLALLFTLIDIKAAERGLLFACFARFSSQLAARISKHALEQGVFPFLQQRLRVGAPGGQT